MSWYLRSTADQDTHRASGLRADGTVATECGLQFRPRPLPMGGVALPGHPQDRDQICPDCKLTKVTR